MFTFRQLERVFGWRRRGNELRDIFKTTRLRFSRLLSQYLLYVFVPSEGNADAFVKDLIKALAPQVNGKAVWSWPGEGSHMEGSFKRGYAHGPGVLYFSDGSRYWHQDGCRWYISILLSTIGKCVLTDKTQANTSIWHYFQWEVMMLWEPASP